MHKALLDCTIVYFFIFIIFFTQKNRAKKATGCIFRDNKLVSICRNCTFLVDNNSLLGHYATTEM